MVRRPATWAFPSGSYPIQAPWGIHTVDSSSGSMVYTLGWGSTSWILPAVWVPSLLGASFKGAQELPSKSPSEDGI